MTVIAYSTSKPFVFEAMLNVLNTFLWHVLENLWTCLLTCSSHAFHEMPSLHIHNIITITEGKVFIHRTSQIENCAKKFVFRQCIVMMLIVLKSKKWLSPSINMFHCWLHVLKDIMKIEVVYCFIDCDKEEKYSVSLFQKENEAHILVEMRTGLLVLNLVTPH